MGEVECSVQLPVSCLARCQQKIPGTTDGKHDRAPRSRARAAAAAAAAGGARCDDGVDWRASAGRWLRGRKATRGRRADSAMKARKAAIPSGVRRTARGSAGEGWLEPPPPAPAPRPDPVFGAVKRRP